MLTYTMGDDLALQGGSLTSVPTNPLAGDNVTLIVTAMNLGDSIQESIPVAFYQGDPANGGIKIGETTIDFQIIIDSDLSRTWRWIIWI